MIFVAILLAGLFVFALGLYQKNRLKKLKKQN